MSIHECLYPFICASTIALQFRFVVTAYSVPEDVDNALASIINPQYIMLASPVTFRITPLTVDDALDQGIIDIFTPEIGLSPLDILRSPTRASE